MGNHPMNAPIPTDPQRTDAASGDRSPQPDPEPIHSVAFQSKPAGIGRPSDAPPRQPRFWALAAVFIGILVYVLLWGMLWIAMKLKLLRVGFNIAGALHTYEELLVGWGGRRDSKTNQEVSK